MLFSSRLPARQKALRSVCSEGLWFSFFGQSQNVVETVSRNVACGSRNRYCGPYNWIAR